MTLADRVEALRSLGFSDRQTRFIVMAALHSGFCLRRQYAAFGGLQHGQGVRDFFDRLVRRGLAAPLRLRPDRGDIYHLCSTRLYRAIGQDDNRNRRYTSPGLIARKVMLFDYALLDPTADWFVTEEDKVRLFTNDFAVPSEDLPRRRYRAHHQGSGVTVRNFIHKLPIRLESGSNVVCFVFLVTTATEASFGEFLNDHAALFGRLPTWRVVAVLPGAGSAQRCEAAFERFRNRNRGNARVNDSVELRTYFRLRAAADRGDLARLSVTEIDALRIARRRFAGRAVERTYESWGQQGDAALLDQAPPNAVAMGPNDGELVIHRLQHRYDAFGSRPGVC